jgi:alpha-amylase
LTWAGHGDISFFLGNARQWDLFLRMQAALAKAQLTRRASWVDLALRLMQSDHLHMLHWDSAWGPEADVSMYFTPGEWWQMGRAAIIAGLGDVFARFNQALDAQRVMAEDL